MPFQIFARKKNKGDKHPISFVMSVSNKERKPLIRLTPWEWRRRCHERAGSCCGLLLRGRVRQEQEGYSW